LLSCGGGGLAVADLPRLAIFACHLTTDDRGRAFDFVRHRLADVVEQTHAPRLFLVEAEFRRHDAANISGFYRMHQDILAVAVAVLQHAEQLEQFRMEAVYPQFEHGALTSFSYRLFHLLLGFLHHCLNPRGVDATVGNEALEGDPGNFPTNGAVARDQYRLRCVINNEVHPRGRLDRADVPPLPADDSPLHV